MAKPDVLTDSASAAAARSGEPAGAPVLARGPETVINPERRAAVLPGAAALPGGSSTAPPATPRSSIVRVLFPATADDGSPSAFDAQQGVELGHFRIIERIRSGGMGAVFRAIDLRLNRVVALKVLPPAMSREASIVQRFLNEAQAAAQLDHENIARVYFVGEEQGLHFIAFEFVTGVNVRELIAQHRRLPAGDAVNFGLQIASALVHTSAQGVVHRDIKPSNIIITPAGRAKLVDLGLARQERQSEAGQDLTVAGTTLGTFDYISPEQARDPRSVDVRSDIYSLGCTLYHMLTGEPPYPEGTVLQKLLQHQGDEAPDPALKNREVSQDLSVVVRKMMAKDPRRRYQSAEQLMRDLMLVAGSMGLRSVSPEGLVWLSANAEKAPFWERHAAWLAAGAALLLIVAYLEISGVQNPPLAPAAIRSGEPAATTFPSGSGVDRAPGGNDATASPAREAVAARPPADGSLRDGAASASSGMKAAGSGASPGTLAPSFEDTFDDIDWPQTGSPATAAQGGAIAPAPSAPNSPRAGIGHGVTHGNSTGTSVDAVTRAAEDRGKGLADNTGRSSESPAVERNVAREPGPALARSTPVATTPIDNEKISTAPPAGNEGIVLLGRDGASDRSFPSLEAACAAVRQDGAVIELRFDGCRVESGLRINRKVAIRAGLGRRPVIEFHPQQVVVDDQVRAVSISSGALDVVDVDLVLSVDDALAAETWSVFSLERPDSLRASNVTLTVVNPRHRAVAVVELRPSPSAAMSDMPSVGTPVRPPLEIELDECFIRGQADLFVVRQNDPLRLAVRQSVVALRGVLFSSRGAVELMHENVSHELRMEHVTAAVAGGLVRLDCGLLPRKLAPVQVSASDCIFSNAGGAPLVAMAGNLPAADFRTLLFWVGKNNIYDRFQSFWSIQPVDASSRAEVWDFATWRSAWTSASEANPRQVDDSIWSQRGWGDENFSLLVPRDFSLDRKVAGGNPAVAWATNLRDAGANLAAVPEPHIQAGTFDVDQLRD